MTKVTIHKKAKQLRCPRNRNRIRNRNRSTPRILFVVDGNSLSGKLGGLTISSHSQIPSKHSPKNPDLSQTTSSAPRTLLQLYNPCVLIMGSFRGTGVEGYSRLGLLFWGLFNFICSCTYQIIRTLE